MRPILLDSPEACEKELTRCTNGLAYLDHAHTLAIDAKEEAEVEWEVWEATAAAECGEKGITATELKGRIVRWREGHEEAAAAYSAYRQAKAQLDKIARWYRTAEQRSTNAQAALKKHLGGARYGGRE